MKPHIRCTDPQGLLHSNSVLGECRSATTRKGLVEIRWAHAVLMLETDDLEHLIDIVGAALKRPCPHCGKTPS